MKKILIVDDDEGILTLLKNELLYLKNIKPYFAKSYKETMTLIREHKGDFHAAILELNMPDAKNGELLSLANAHKIPSVILTSSEDSNLKETILKKDIIDFIQKDGPLNIKYAVNAISRTLKNYDTTVLIVDDSKMYRQIVSDTLNKIHINVLEACNGQEALDILGSNNHISLVLTDYEMPKLNGLELIFKIREKYTKDKLGVIAISSADEQDIITKFLKYGANDFIHKPFTYNEVVTRVNSNLELLDLFQSIKDMANKDFLTGAYNRRFFFEAGEVIYLKAKRKDSSLAVAMIDIDKFKNINDTYGHDVGDIAIKEIKKVLDESLRASDLMARFGGEEFCILLENITIENIEILFEKIRQKFEKNIININDLTISYTVSIGIYYGASASLEDMIRLSDEALYKAKESGRNKVVIQAVEN